MSEPIAGEPLDRDTRMWGMLCHLSALARFAGVPLGNILGRAIVWMIKKEDHPLIDEQGKESLNFQISMTIYTFASALLCLVGLPLVFLVMLGGAVFTIIGAVKANDGISYRYPLTIRFIQ